MNLGYDSDTSGFELDSHPGIFVCVCVCAWVGQPYISMQK